MKLLNVDGNAKTVKGQKKGYLTGILYLAPARLSGFEVCPKRSPDCTNLCLNYAGMGVFSNVQHSRIAKTKFYFNDRAAFMAQLGKEIAALCRKAAKLGFIPVVRLNGTSDIAWETVPYGGFSNIFEAFPALHYYDYTKVPKRMLKFLNNKMPPNYHLTFSADETNEKDCANVLGKGGSVAMVFDKVPSKYNGFTVVNGDEDDLRFLDPRGVVIGLKAKGKARNSESKFIRKAA